MTLPWAIKVSFLPLLSPFSPHSNLFWARDYGPTLQVNKQKTKKPQGTQKSPQSPQVPHSAGREWSLDSNSGLGKVVTAFRITPWSPKPVFQTPYNPSYVCGPLWPALLPVLRASFPEESMGAHPWLGCLLPFLPTGGVQAVQVCVHSSPCIPIWVRASMTGPSSTPCKAEKKHILSFLVFLPHTHQCGQKKPWVSMISLGHCPLLVRNIQRKIPPVELKHRLSFPVCPVTHLPASQPGSFELSTIFLEVHSCS